MQPPHLSGIRRDRHSVIRVAIGTIIALTSSAAMAGPRPSIEITGSVANVCDNGGGSLNPNVPTYINRYIGASTLAEYAVAGVGIVEQNIENEPFDADFAGSFGFNPDPYDVAPGTLVTVTMTTHRGLDLTGEVAYVSEVVFACDTGAISSLVNQDFTGVTAVPTSGRAGSIVLLFVLGALGVVMLRAG